MKKKIWIPIIAIFILLAVLILFFLKGTIDDKGKETFTATVLEINGDTVIVEPFDNAPEKLSSDKISFSTADLEDINATLGSEVEITYTGSIEESYPAQITATSWKLATMLRDVEYTKPWISKTEGNKHDDDLFDHIVITKIYSNCFFASAIPDTQNQIKLNGTLSEKWCVGDRIICTYENTYYDPVLQRIEADMLTIEASTLNHPDYVAHKPVIYLCPEKETDISVTLNVNGKLTCTYPEYKDGWEVSASPDGTLKDADGQVYNYLYWEGELNADYDFSSGFCVKGEDTAKFLESATQKLGLNRKEANEFIVYWLPLMEKNPYNVISFQTDVYTDAAKLDIDPAPDTLIRVFMAWKKSETFVNIPTQSLTAGERDGFTVIEWGGTEIK